MPCEMCGRDDKKLTFHHLIPKQVVGRNKYQKRFSPEELEKGIDVCRCCHDGLHQLYSEKILAEQYNTLEKILEDDRIQKHIKWSRKQK